MNNFVRYVWDTGEPVNILEAFIVVEHHDKTILFLALGWLLIISDAPFIKRNTYLILCRSSRRKWNIAMWQYIMIQAFLYTACIATVSIIACIFSGFSGSIWSSPVYDLAMDKGNNLGVKYNMTFGWTNIMENMTVPQAFAVTFIFLFLYLAVLGNLLYV
ncbi:MAG: hypothetical protein K2G19_04925, partial [Lachnospiraceae bacterium]|nr:hypothetical protein [Lachnospiraceae bacterium]